MPWRSVVPESDTPLLRPVQQFFVGIVLMVHRAPSRVRTMSFAREVEQWLERVVATALETRTIVEETIETESFKPPESSAPIRVNPIQSPPVMMSQSAPSPEGAVLSVAKKPEQIKIANAVFRYEEEPPVTPGVVTSVAQTEPIVEETTLPETVAPVIATEPLDAVAIETNLGGLFYLINLAIFLEIYSDFTSPVEQFHDDLSIWDFVAIVGREINQDRDLDDPIWTGLQDLQNNHDNPENPEILSKPPWLTDLLPHIKARLILALGIEDEAALSNLLLHHYAKVTITPTHLDVFFSLADHPIEIRLSGLDRNPGWVPAAGRFIAFHYD